MFGNNPKRSIFKSDGTILQVKEIFKTLQGEGTFVGMPAIFIRLGGCNLACSFCDTSFEDFTTLSLQNIIEQVNFLNDHDNIKLIVITGGEPLRQPIELLCEALINLGYVVQIETNGTLYRPMPKQVYIVCSPKNIMGIYQPIREDLLQVINAFKFLVSKHISGYDTIPNLGQDRYNIEVFIQPIDEYDAELNKANQMFALELALKTGSRLSLQTHKILGIA